MEPDPQISQLLRLKRYEQPPEGYETSFLREFHRRQRAVLLERPWYARAWDSFMQIWPDFEVPKLAYAGAAAVAVIAAVGLVSSPSGGTRLASAGAPAEGARLTLETRNPVTISGTMPVSAQVGGPVSPHYILQPRPASNDRPLSF